MLTPEEYDRLARSDCFVCRIVAGNPLIPDPRIVYEDEHVIAFLSDFPTREGYTIVCPKRHVERHESDLTEAEWLHLQVVVRKVSRAVAATTKAMRMYLASLGSPERNPHLHIHVCPCPPGTPFEQQQFAAMMKAPDGWYMTISEQRMGELAEQIWRHMREDTA
jgi:diadenosine tetraphosphate (Ap4A) HIT family hydrolase